MRKSIFAFVCLLTVLLSACGVGLNNDFSDASDAAATVNETTEATMSTTDEAITTTTTTSKRAIQQAQVQTNAKTEATTKMEDKIIALNLETNRGNGTLTFKSVRLYCNETINKNMAVFSYGTSDVSAVMPIESDTNCLGKSGKLYECKGIGGTGNAGEIHIYDVTDFSDLSTCTLTYAFEGYDPVTVTIQIPGL